MTIQDLINKYKGKLDYLDAEILIAHSLDKTREFVLTYPETKVPRNQSLIISKKIQRRITGEPIAYILGHKEFYGLDFIVNKHTLVPRPETEQIVDLVVTSSLQSVTSKNSNSKNIIIDIGTGSGNIITSIAKTLTTSYQLRVTSYDFYASDTSNEALKIAKKNAKIHGLDKKIKFLRGNLLMPFLTEAKKLMPSKLVITANLPYLSKEIYDSAPIDVKKFEPKSALYSPEQGLQHYRKLLEQLASIHNTSYKINTTCILEISPEQKTPITRLIKSIFPIAKIEFEKDLAGKWRICKINV